VNELELIELLTRSLPTNKSVIVGTGDDCAVLDVGAPDTWLLFKTDAVVEGVHFLKSEEPARIGRKAVARCLSDVAAMAGQPGSALVTLGLPGDYTPEFVQGMYDGMKAIARDYELAIVGGETVPNPGGVFVSIAMLATVHKDRCVLRSGAQPGDALFVTGELGGSIAGRHLDFEPRVREAQWLAGAFEIHAMIDVSDGLASDLPHLLKASGTGAELLAGAIPVSRAARLSSRQSGGAKTPLAAALTDGEDFELLFTVASKDAVPLLDGFKRAFPRVPITCIGKISGEPGLRLRDQHGVRSLAGHGYVHFEKP
jgi:thiamine-monophosphate kinase